MIWHLALLRSPNVCCAKKHNKALALLQRMNQSILYQHGKKFCSQNSNHFLIYFCKSERAREELLFEPPPPPYTYKSSHWSGQWEGKPHNSRGIKSPIIFGITKGNKRHYIGVKLLTYFSNKCLNCAEDVDTGEEAF